MRTLFVLIITTSLILISSPCWAGIPFLMNYQGMLTDTLGNPLTGSHNLTFKIYSQSSGGSALWLETHTNTQVQDGLFNVILGSLTLLPSSVFDDTVRYLGITVEPEAELTPRIRITSIPYAYRALVADSAAVAGSVVGGVGGWVDDGDVVRLETSADKVGIGTTTPDDDLHVANHIRVGEDTNYPTVYGELKHDGGGDGFKINAHAGGGTWADIHFQTNASTKMFIESAGKVGIGTTSPSEKLDVEGNIDVSDNEVKNYFGFPQPDYNSGWVSISQGENKTFTHNLGGSYNNYFVDLTLYDNTGGSTGPLTQGLGGDRDGTSYWGAYWYELNNSSIKVRRSSQDGVADWVRVRIWVIR